MPSRPDPNARHRAPQLRTPSAEAPDHLDGEWQAAALCAQIPPDDVAWFPEYGRTSKGETRAVHTKARFDEAMASRRLCNVCPVAGECLDLAMVAEYGTGHTYRFGIYGGVSPQKRVELEKEGYFDVRKRHDKTQKVA